MLSVVTLNVVVLSVVTPYVKYPYPWARWRQAKTLGPRL